MHATTALPAFPSPGIGAMLQVACVVMCLRNSGYPDDVVDQWRENARAHAHVPTPTESIPPLSQPS
jgi:hypothetical protein